MKFDKQPEVIALLGMMLIVQISLNHMLPGLQVYRSPLYLIYV